MDDNFHYDPEIADMVAELAENGPSDRETIYDGRTITTRDRYTGEILLAFMWRDGAWRLVL